MPQMMRSQLEGIDPAMVLVNELLPEVYALLKGFAARDDFWEKMSVAFGDEFDQEKLESLRQQWASGNLEKEPSIEIRSAAELKGANGAFAAATNTIYLSRDFLEQNSSNLQSITDVVLEEYGHFIDSQINTSDADGDEGKIFSNLEKSINLDSPALQALKAEDDTAVVTVNGKVIQIEQAEPTFNINQILSGLKNVLGNTQSQVNQLFGGTNLSNINGIIGGLPLLGSDFKDKATAIGSSGQFLQSLYDKVETKFKDVFGTGGVIDNAKDAARTEIQNALFQVLGPANLDILKDSDDAGTNISADDIKVDVSSGELKVDCDLGGQITLADVSLPKNIGLPQLGLNFQGDPKLGVGLDYTFKLGFGINPASGFFFNANPNKELTIGLTPTLPKTAATFGFLKVDATDKGTGLDFFIDLNDGNDNIIRPGESLGFTPEGTADIKLNFLSSIEESAVLPKIGTDLNLQWQFTNGTKPTISFDNTTLYLGSFLSKFVGPIVDPIQKITKPIQKATSFLTEPIGLLGDLGLGGSQHNLLGLARQFNPENPTIDNVIKAIDAVNFIGDLSTLVNSFDPSAGELGINVGTVGLGSFDLTSGNPISAAPLNATAKSLAELEQEFNNKLAELDPATASKFQAQKEFFVKKDSIKNFGLSFPILEEPKSAIGLLTGQTVDFFKFDVPDFDFNAGIRGSFRIPPVPILKVSFGGEIGAKLNLGFGYDSTGIQQWASGGYQSSNVEKIFDGFYIDDNRNGANDLAELQVIGTLKAGVGADVIIAEGEVNGGIQATVNIDLEDQGESGKNLGSSDGRIRPSEFISILKDNPGCLFEIGGQLDAFLGYYARVGWPPLGKEWEGELARTTLADFGIQTCPDKKPILANDGPETFPGGTLDLNIGLRADKRKFINTIDHNEVFQLKGSANTSNETIIVRALGYTQNYIGVTKIVANAGELDDSIQVENIAIPVEYSGGNGNDELSGSETNDVINGDSGNDRLFGRGGNDILSGGIGKDFVNAGEGNDKVSGGDDNDNLLGKGGIDTIDGDAGNDFIDGGADNDKLYGDTDDSQAGNDIILGGDGDDDIYGRAGNDNLSGGTGADFLYGGTGDDELLGDDGDDFLHGGLGNDNISGGNGIDTVSYENSPSGVVVNIDEEESYTILSAFASSYLISSINAGEALDGFGTSDRFKFSSTRETFNEDTGEISTQTFDVSGNLENIVGSRSVESGDILAGNSQNNYIQGLEGNDFLDGKAGDDTLEGSAGEDVLIGKSGNDLIDGGDGNDTVTYENSPKGVIVNIDENTNYGNQGGTIHSSDCTGNQPIPTDLEPTYQITAGTADDGFGTTDTLRNLEAIVGSSFDDVLIGNEKDNTLIGSDGNDLLIGNAGADTLDGGDGIDTVSYRRDPKGVNVDLGLIFVAPGMLPAQDGFGATDMLNSIENVIGSSFNDTIRGSAVNNSLFAGSGDDSVSGGSGNDILFGEDGNDTLRGDSGDDFLVGGKGADLLDGGTSPSGIPDKDVASYFTSESGVIVSLKTGSGSAGDAKGDQLIGIENLEGSEFGDSLEGNDSNNQFCGLAGNDLISGLGGNDTLHGDDGNDSLYGGNGNDLAEGGAGNDLLNGEAGNDTLKGNDGNDSLYGGAGNDQAEGGAGNDLLRGEDGADQLFGNAGGDSIEGGKGNDTINGGEDNDRLTGGSGQDQFVIQRGTGTDTITDFVGFGPGSTPSAEKIPSIPDSDPDKWMDTLKFEGSGLTARNMLLAQKGDNVEITFEGVSDTKVILQNFELENLDNGVTPWGSFGILFDGDKAIVDSFDVFNHDWNPERIFSMNSVTFLNDLDNETVGYDYSNDGSISNDVINGLGGNDNIKGLLGNDLLRGGQGNDSLYGGKGNDTLQGNEGNDKLYGEEDSDRLDGGLGNDTLVGGTGADQLTGGAGVNTFVYSSLSHSRLASFDAITDFKIGTDILDGPNPVSTASLLELGTVASLDPSGIQAVLTPASFAARGAATFTFGSGSSQRTFLALNDATPGFSATTDAIIEITGFTGSLSNLAIL
jgi:Ca2+-binding RTX toxin-like protein